MGGRPLEHIHQLHLPDLLEVEPLPRIGIRERLLGRTYPVILLRRHQRRPEGVGERRLDGPRSQPGIKKPSALARGRERREGFISHLHPG